ncbi:phosphotransferase family protein [Streptomonospora nanhaiensis]|uniref:Aminoglycoside phosphotransferase (APT) family kinase protein n=1 Tax=Streptomonospora nanhaiensis TaxID=1323731 RepID=A0A853BK34_9ACTN|nr:aminoglycoside phosphotransferase family protein [Streptomonospora nanhaiensis]MBV2364123.1 aminoglycoside phosphotransferase family protein [Streptomonospora nanhaiensis]MBX9388480.1 aminoglycoside phosphotransferase family protein [Streptomonospora nanhaiensis]NYI95074.1 aminoglycoside phosphotransferase (APT) family kinase protein [Streptomonospora nanhaiensis]
MDFRPIERTTQAFQQPVTAEEVQRVYRRVFGSDSRVVSAVELGSGMYNNVYRVALAERDRPVVLRVAPAKARQFRSERHLMRNEHAGFPWLAPIAHLMPQVIAADWTGQVIGRDWMIQTYLEGVPAPEHLGSYPRSTWPAFFRQMGAITRAVHDVRGPHFGPVAGPGYATWSEAVIASLEDIAADLDGAGLEATDVRRVAAAARHDRAVLDEVTEPRLLTGDLWTVNTLLDRDADVPTISGVLDFDRCHFGDPDADWTIRMATAKADEREAFWESYGPLDRSEAAVWRARVYEARHLGAVRLERYRLGKAEAVSESYGAMAAVLAQLA